MEYIQTVMNQPNISEIVPGEHEAERASNSYLMSVVAVMAGLPLPIFNLIASVIFFFGNRKSTYFVRWHCTQALLSQLSLLFMNSYAFWWTISVAFGDESISNHYLAYLFTAILFNLIEFISTIYSAIQVRKGKHVSWMLFGEITNFLVKS
jgi:uncharacterized membrane protein